MPQYTIRDPQTGRTITIRGDSPPTEQELVELFASASPMVNVGDRASFTVNNQPVSDLGPAPPGVGGGVPFSSEEFTQTDQTPDPGLLSGAWNEVGAPLAALPGALAQQQTGAVETLGRAFRGRAGFGESADAAGALLGGPAYLMGKGVVKGAVEQGSEAFKALIEQRFPEFQGHSLATMLLALGPDAASIAEDIKTRPRYGFGRLAALLGTLGVPSLLKAIPRSAQAAIPAERAAASAMLERGVPVDLGTATGNRFVRGAQYLGEQTPLGSVAEQTARTRRGAEMSRVGAELADETTPGMMVTPETAGQVVQEGLQGRVKDLSREADTAYGRLRELENAPGAEGVVDMRRSLAVPDGVTLGEASELRRMLAELEEVQYTPKTWTKQDTVRGDQATNFDITAGHANAPVYAEVMGDLSPITAKQLRNAIDAGLNGRRSAWYDRALDVARARINGTSKSAILPPGAGDTARHVQMAAPVDLQQAKATLTPMADELRANMAALKGAPSQMRLTGLQQTQAQALTLLDEILQMPDYAPASAVDGALSNLKRIVRGADSPFTMTPHQRTAVVAIDELEKGITEALTKVGPEALEARTTGRAATRGKYEAVDLADRVKAEPVRAYKEFVSAGDTSIAKLRELERITPGKGPIIGRAFLEDLLQQATADGGFAHGPRIAQAWQKLGPETKRILYPDRAHRASLDQFFLVSRRLADSANVSNTAGVTTTKEMIRMMATGASGAGLYAAPLQTLSVLLGAGGMVKAFHSPAFVRAVLRVLGASKGAPGRQAAAMRGAVVAAKSAGVQPAVAIPALAREEER